MKRYKLTAIVVAAALLASAVIPAVVVATFKRVTVSDYPGWWEATATAFAFAAAAFAAVLAFRTAERELQRDDERDKDRRSAEEDRRRAQADKVAAWSDEIWVVWGATEDGPRAHIRSDGRFHMINRSGLPVTNVSFQFSLRAFLDGSTTEWSLGRLDTVVVPPSDTPLADLIPTDILDAAGDELSDYALTTGETERIESAMTVGIAFTDTADRHWIREPSGRLLPAPDALAQLRARNRL